MGAPALTSQTTTVRPQPPGTQTFNRPNAYPAGCIRCHGRVGAGKGHLAKDQAGKWAADHGDDGCPESPVVVATVVARPNSDGIYRDDDGIIWKVQVAVHGSGQLYAKRLYVTQDPDGKRVGHFEYVAGAIHRLRADQRVSLDEARKYGALYGVCIACGATLTDETSIAAGLGPVCGKRYF